MRLNNGAKVGYYNFLSTAITMLVLFGILSFLLERYLYGYLGKSAYLLLIIPIFIGVLFYLRGRQIFEYDSDGETLNFKNRNVVLFLDKPLNDEFPKYKLLEYDIVNAIVLRRLYITIYSKKNANLGLKYDISYLTKKEVNDLKFSLSRVIKNNRELKSEKIS